MKRLFLAVIALSLPIIAQEKPTFTKAKIKQATVYFTGAALTHTASANIPKGTSELVIKNVANTLSEETIRVLAPSNVTGTLRTIYQPIYGGIRYRKIRSCP